jgi:hypothetical protein
MPKAQQTSSLLSSAGRPLPIVGSWNTGQFQTTQNEDKGFDPSWQAWMIRKGWPLMMSFEFFEKYRTPNMRQVRSLHYTKGWEMVKRRKLPVSFVGENWEDRFRLETQYNVMRTDGTENHPFIENADGSRQALASCYGNNVHWWKHLGTQIGTYLRNEFALDYPDAPKVYLYNNAETGYARAGQELDDVRRPAWIDAADGQAKVFHAAYCYGIRRAALIQAIKDACPEWADVIECFAYGGWANEFGASALNNNPNKRHYERPWGAGKFPYNCAGWVGYIHDWQTWEPDTLRSPPLEACNSRWALDLYQKTYDRGFIMDTMYWNGKGDDAEVWKGICRQVMWIMQTEHHRLFTPSGATRAVTMDRDYVPLLQAAREIHENAVLKKFWQHGNLVTNRWTRDFDEIPVDGNGDTSTGYGHPYNWPASEAHLDHFRDAGDRWFQQHVPLNGRYEKQGAHWRDLWQANSAHDRAVKIWAIAHELDGEYLIQACAPRGAESAVEIQICPTGHTPVATITVDVPVSGGFWLFRPQAQQAVEVTTAAL